MLLTAGRAVAPIPGRPGSRPKRMNSYRNNITAESISGRKAGFVGRQLGRGAALWRASAVLLCLAVLAAHGAGVDGGAAPANDFTTLDLDQLMQVKVPLVHGASTPAQK